MYQGLFNSTYQPTSVELDALNGPEEYVKQWCEWRMLVWPFSFLGPYLLGQLFVDLLQVRSHATTDRKASVCEILIDILWVQGTSMLSILLLCHPFPSGEALDQITRTQCFLSGCAEGSFLISLFEVAAWVWLSLLTVLLCLLVQLGNSNRRSFCISLPLWPLFSL